MPRSRSPVATSSGFAPRHHRRSDLPEHVQRSSLAAAEEFCVELIERLDARVGAELD